MAGTVKRTVWLVGAAHVDRLGRLDHPAERHRSNPGRFSAEAGGAVFNVASCLACLGARPHLSTILGHDDAARMIHKVAAERGVALDVQTSHVPTASYTAVLEPDGALELAVADMVIYEEFDPARAHGPARTPDWLLCDTNLPEPIIGRILERPAGSRGAMTVSAAKAPRLRPYLGELDLLFTNRAEAAALANADPQSPLPQLAGTLAGLGLRRAVVSDGTDPLCLLDGGEVLQVDIPHRASPPVDVTGAGDALAAAFLAALMAGQPARQAVHAGIAAAQAILDVESAWRQDLRDAIERHTTPQETGP